MICCDSKHHFRSKIDNLLQSRKLKPFIMGVEKRLRHTPAHLSSCPDRNGVK